MRIPRFILTVLLLPALVPAKAQSVVVDPTHIGVAIENTASSLNEMITMIEEMFALNEKFDDLYGLAEKVDEVADRFREVGYLVDMTDAYNTLLQRTVNYSKQIKEWAAEDGIYGYERELRYLYRCEKTGIKLFNQYMEFFRALKTSDADKAAEARVTLREMEKEIRQMDLAMSDVGQVRKMGQGLSATMEFFDRNNTVDDYVNTYRRLGSAEHAADDWIDLIRVLQLLLLAFMGFMSVILIMRGQDLGNNVSSTTPVRLAVAGAASFLLLDILGKVIV